METIKIVPQEIKSPFMRIDSLIVPEADIPKEFSMMNNNKWVKLFEDMFFMGIKIIEATPKQGIDRSMAFKHIRCIASDWGISQEHKTACCAYLFSLWFEDIKYEVNKNE